MNDLQTQTQYPILSYSGNSIRHFSTNGTKVSLSKNYTASEEVLYRALFLIPVCSIWGMAWKNPVVLNASKIFLHLLPGPNFPDNKFLHFLITLIWPSPTLDILGVSLTTKTANLIYQPLLNQLPWSYAFCIVSANSFLSSRYWLYTRTMYECVVSVSCMCRRSHSHNTFWRE